MVGLRMRPLTLAERWATQRTPTVSLSSLLEGERGLVEGSTDAVLADHIAEIVEGGFPAMRGMSGRARTALMDGYLDRIVDSDFPEAGYTARNPAALRRWMEAYAALVSTDASYEKIRDAPSRDKQRGLKTLSCGNQPYNDTLE